MNRTLLHIGKFGKANAKTAGIVLGACVVFSASYPILHGVLGKGAGILSVAPVLAVAWWRGKWWAPFAAVTMLLTQLVLANTLSYGAVVGEAGWLPFWIGNLANLGLALVVGTLRDLSRQLNEAIAARDARSRWLSTLSHEIRTPLNGVIGMTQIVRANALSAEQQERVDIIAESAEQLLSLVNDILDFSRIDSGRLALERMPVDVRGLLRQVRLILLPNARAGHVQVFVDCADDVPPWVMGDPTRLRQILLNLAGNAVKFSEGGWVRVTVRLAAAHRMQVVVQDSGVGIAEDQLHTIFEPFAQAGAHVARRYGGTGLGLAITRQLVELMEGSLSVTSTVGVGTTFVVDLPVVETAALETAESITAPALNYRVLVVEDNPINQLVAKGLLEHWGCVVTIAPHGQAAIEILNDHSFDVVLMDLEMPVMGGLEATRAIRSGAAGPGAARTPIIAMTANGAVDERAHCLEEGMDDFLTKPMRGLDVQTTLARWAERRQSERFAG